MVLFTTCMRYTIALETGPDRFLTGTSTFCVGTVPEQHDDSGSYLKCILYVGHRSVFDIFFFL